MGLAIRSAFLSQKTACTKSRSPGRWSKPESGLPFGHEPFGHELRAEWLRAEWLRPALRKPERNQKSRIRDQKSHLIRFPTGGAGPRQSNAMASSWAEKN